MGSRIADSPCEDCGRPEYEHRRERVRLEDGQYIYQRVCPDD